jgi:hypothetical protein
MENERKDALVDSSESKYSQSARSDTYQQSRSDDEGVLDLRFLFSEIYKKWWLVIGCVAISGYFGIQNAHNFQPSYKAKMVVAPIESNAVGSSSSSGNLIGVVTGLNLRSSQKATKFDRLVYLTKTITFAKHMDNKFQLMDRIYGDGFDKATNSWIKPEGRRFEFREKLNSFLNMRTWTPPSLEDLANYIGGSLNVAAIEKSPFKIISFKHSNPKQALEFLNIVFGEAERLVRKEDEIEQQKRRKFLEDRFAGTQIVEFREALTAMIAEQARLEMMSHGDLPSVARIVDPPFVSKYKDQPNMLKLLGVPIFGGFSFALGIILLLTLIRRE